MNSGSTPAESAPLTLVTGASRGLGRAIALEAARAGHDLVLLCRQDEAALSEVAEAASRFGSNRVFSHACEVSDEAAVEALFSRIAGYGRLTAVANCAGFTGERASLAQAEIGAIDRILAVNVRGTILFCRQAIGQMSRLNGGQGGAIVNLSSQTARFGGDRLAVYAASKAAIEGFTISLARELAPAGIRVNAVSPGAVLTDPLKALPEQKLREMQANMPMGRFCEPEEVARTVLWLLSDAASYVSGAVVPVHGAR